MEDKTNPDSFSVQNRLKGDLKKMNDDHISELLRSTVRVLNGKDLLVIDSTDEILRTKFPKTIKCRAALMFLKMILKGRRTITERILGTFLEEFPSKSYTSK